MNLLFCSRGRNFAVRHGERAVRRCSRCRGSLNRIYISARASPRGSGRHGDSFNRRARPGSTESRRSRGTVTRALTTRALKFRPNVFRIYSGHERIISPNTNAVCEPTPHLTYGLFSLFPLFSRARPSSPIRRGNLPAEKRDVRNSGGAEAAGKL